MTSDKTLCDVPLKPSFLTGVKTSSMRLSTFSHVKSKTYTQKLHAFMSQIDNLPHKIYLKKIIQDKVLMELYKKD